MSARLHNSPSPSVAFDGRQSLLHALDCELLLGWGGDERSGGAQPEGDRKVGFKTTI